MMKILLFSGWLLRDFGFLYWAFDAYRCKRLLVNVEDTFMDEAPWTVMICSISRSRWKLRKMQNVCYAAQRNGHLLHSKAASIADSSPASLPLPLRVEPKPKSGIRQHDLLKKVVEVKPKRPRVSSPRDDKNATVSTIIKCSANSKTEAKQGEKVSPSVGSDKAKDNGDNPIKSLLVAYVNSDSDED
ncbi:uncharacterized protein LOC141672541 isoform X2 [Apium graveolens]|uniref:uncharacterized protein LOC141672541 isoform X2 n=1 Tax=Apium graveolens TaxID=4045 RepID=UPI003D792EB0